MTQLLTDIQMLESQHKQNTMCTGETELLKLRRQVTELLQHRAKAALQRCRKYYYETGDKCGRSLARALQEQRTQSYVPHLVDPEGRKVHFPSQIVSTFLRFYQSLYSLPTRSQPQNIMEEYISSSGISQLTEQIREELDVAITLE